MDETRLALVLRFSDRELPEAVRGTTIGEHQNIINNEHIGYCWWGWWRAENSYDRGVNNAELLQEVELPCTIGLWLRSENKFFTAQCSDIRTSHGYDIVSPALHATPPYYQSRQFPAWFKLTSISPSSKAGFSRRFGALPDAGVTDTTIIWPASAGEQVSRASTLTRLRHKRHVLHLSDVHFGGSHRWRTAGHKTRVNVALETAILETLEQKNIASDDIGLIVLSGDLVSGRDRAPRSTPTIEEDFADALAFVKYLLTQFGIDSDCVVTVPGNHDIQRRDIDLLDEKSYDFTGEYPDPHKREDETQYRQFVEQLYGETSSITRTRSYLFDETTRLNFAQLNSTRPRDQYTRELGYVGQAHLQQFGKMKKQYTDAHEARSALRVINWAVMHHHLISTLQVEWVPRPDPAAPHDRVDPMSATVDHSRLIDEFSNHRIRMVLHGHQHQSKWRVIANRRPSGGRLFMTEVVGAPSAGVKDADIYGPDKRNAFNLYTVEGDRLRIRTFPFTENLEQHEPVTDASIPIEGECEL